MCTLFDPLSDHLRFVSDTVIADPFHPLIHVLCLAIELLANAMWVSAVVKISDDHSFESTIIEVGPGLCRPLTNASPNSIRYAGQLAKYRHVLTMTESWRP